MKRARAAKIHAYIISQLKKEMPALMGKAKAQRKLTNNLESVFEKVTPSFPPLQCNVHIYHLYMLYLLEDLNVS